MQLPSHHRDVEEIEMRDPDYWARDSLPDTSTESLIVLLIFFGIVFVLTGGIDKVLGLFASTKPDGGEEEKVDDN